MHFFLNFEVTAKISAAIFSPIFFTILSASAIDVADLFNQEEISRGLRSRWEKLYKTKYEGGPKPVAVESQPKG